LDAWEHTFIWFLVYKVGQICTSGIVNTEYRVLNSTHWPDISSCPQHVGHAKRPHEPHGQASGASAPYGPDNWFRLI
jgi:hypothetical protein